MDEATKAVAKEKSDVINERIGFPDFILNDDQLDERYREVRCDLNESIDDWSRRCFVSAVEHQQ